MISEAQREYKIKVGFTRYFAFGPLKAESKRRTETDSGPFCPMKKLFIVDV